MARPRAAFSLGEVILSTSILLLVLMTVVSIFPSSAFAVRKGEIRLEADNLAQASLEDCRGGDFATLTVGNVSLGNVTVNNTVFEREQEVFQAPGSTDTDFVKGVRVRIRWTEQNKAQMLQAETWLVHVER